MLTTKLIKKLESLNANDQSIIESLVDRMLLAAVPMASKPDAGCGVDELEQEITRLLEAASSNGLTAAELGRHSRKFRAAPHEVQEATLDMLLESGQVQLNGIPTAGKRGKKRVAYVIQCGANHGN